MEEATFKSYGRDYRYTLPVALASPFTTPTRHGEALLQGTPDTRLAGGGLYLLSPWWRLWRRRIQWRGIQLLQRLRSSLEIVLSRTSTETPSSMHRSCLQDKSLTSS
ncbi:hypothetical protein LB507_006442 [Fusarium sp. FIESC RH6]|nr:hypothetical protein LB507_006442 [Fusarium sp. FIESC RH6]